MSRKIITFLGKYPKQTNYRHLDRVYSGQVFAEAMCQFVEFDHMYVFVTEEAREKSWPVLAALDDERIMPVTIPRGETTTEMWAMFDAIRDCVDKEDTVIFDITHGLRSSPFLVFLFAAYLKTACDVTIEAIYYGAYELGDAQNDIPAPVIDLSEFVSMLDWLTATDRFVRFGDSKDLTTLVYSSKNDQNKQDPIGQAMLALDTLSQSLRLIRPAAAMQISVELPIALENARTEAENIPTMRPYSMLVDDLKVAYSSFSHSQPFDDIDNFEISLNKQRDLIHWYVEHQQWVQAVSLAREWLITWVMWHLGETDFLNRSLRESIAETLGKESHRRKEAKKNKQPYRPIFFRDIPNIDGVLGDWLALAGIRNDIDHAGMRTSYGSASSLIKSISTLCQKLDPLPLERKLNAAET